MMIVAFLCLLIVWLSSFRVMRAKMLDAAGLFLWLFGLLVVSRAALLTFGLDDPFPDHVFRDRDTFDSAATKTMFMATLYLLLSWAGMAVVRRLKISSLPLPFAGDLEVDTSTHRRLLWFFGSVSAIVLVWVLARYGGLQDAINAQKFERQAGSSLRFRSVGTVAASLAVAYMLRVARDEGENRWRSQLVGLAFFAIGGTTAFAWGARDGAVFPLAAGLLFWAFAIGEGSSRKQSRNRLLVGGLALGSLVVSLRLLRDLLAREALAATIAGQSLVRQVSVSANLVQFDAAVLVARDWPAEYEFLGATQLVTGIRNYLPEALGGNAIAVVNGNTRLAQLYVPNRTNGWPHLAIGEWWLAFGWAGLLVGGLLCGVVVELLRRSYRRSTTDPLQLMILVLMTAVIFQFGVREVTFSRLVTIGVPFYLADLYVRAQLLWTEKRAQVEQGVP